MIDLLSTLAPRTAIWLATTSIEMAPLGAVALIADRFLGHRAHSLRAVLWWTVLLRIVIPPVMALPIPDMAPARSAVSALSSSPWSPLAVAAIIWAIGAAASLWLIARRLAGLRTAWNGERIDERSPLWPHLRKTATLGLPQLPDIRLSSQIDGPAVVGFIRPRIVLPTSIVERSPTEIGHVLLHEAAHIVRRDPIAHLACLLAQAVFWFHPVVWIASRRLALLREIGCDRRVVLALGGAATDYRRTLLHLAAPMFAGARPHAVALLGSRSQLVTRLEALAHPVARPRLYDRLLAGSLLAGMLACGVPWSARITPEMQPPDLDALPGSLQKRYAVLRYMSAHAP